jgi:hypothetical protein
VGGYIDDDDTFFFHGGRSLGILNSRSIDLATRSYRRWYCSGTASNKKQGQR